MVTPDRIAVVVRAVLLTVLAAAVGCGGRQVPGVVLPERATPVKPRGQDRGDIEIVLGAVTAAVSATLVGLGIYSARRSVVLREYCAQEPELGAIDMPDVVYESLCNEIVGADPARSSAISSGLAFAFAVPVAVSSGFLLRKGVRMRREYKRVHGVALRPWAPGGRGAGLTFGFAF
jgi:hypothetical protein